MTDYDAVLLLSFGGPEGQDEVMPFLERVVAGRNVPRERLLGVAEHYYAMDGVSPIAARTRELQEALRGELAANGPELPVYLGNRFWHPLLEDTMRQMAEDGVKRAVGVVTAAYSSWSSCRAYHRDIARAREAVPGAPEIDRVRVYFNHPGFVAANVERLREAYEPMAARRPRVLFTAHSIPRAMAEACDYEVQLAEVARLCAEAVGVSDHQLVYQSRSGPPHVPWLEPDVLDAIDALADERPGAAVVLAPIGFVADHMEVVWDLDHEARERAEDRGLSFARARAANDHPLFVGALADLVREVALDRPERPVLGDLPPRPDGCRPGCCPDGRPRA